LRSKLAARIERKDFTIEQRNSFAQIVIDEAKLFRGHQAYVNPIGRAVLCDLAKALKDEKTKIDVTAHATSETVNVVLRVDYPSTWELTTARAAATVVTLSQCGLPADRLLASGAGHHRPLPNVIKDSTGQISLAVHPHAE
jgi:chemotaxis protein MotB